MWKEEERMVDHGEVAEKMLNDLSKGLGHELEAQTLEGIGIEHAREGLVRCKFLIPKHLADDDGFWDVGAMAVLIDDVAAVAVLSVVGYVKVCVSVDISYPSRAKVQEAVEIEAKVGAHMGRLTLVEVRIKKKESDEIVAIAKHWSSSAASFGTAFKLQSSKL